MTTLDLIDAIANLSDKELIQLQQDICTEQLRRLQPVSVPESKPTKAKSSKKLATRNKQADEQLEEIVTILEHEGWTITQGKHRDNMTEFVIKKNNKKIGQLFFHKGTWTLEGKALEIWGGEDAWESTLNDNDILDLWEEE